jgi:hypothetical protein
MNKPCYTCGTDCSTVKRYQDPAGRYFCHPCYERLSTQPPPRSTKAVSQVAAAPAAHRVATQAPAARSARPALPAFEPERQRSSGSLAERPWALAGAVLAPFAAILLLCRFAPALSLLYTAGMFIFVIGLGIAVVVSAFRTSLVQGLLTFFVPFYALYYVYGVSKNPAFMALVPASVVAWLGMFLMLALLPQ